MISLIKLLPATILAWLPAGTVFAQTPDSTANSNTDIFEGFMNQVGRVISGIQGLIVGEVAGSIVVLMIIIGGIQYITGQREAGKKTIVAAIIGTAIIVLAWIIVNIVATRLAPFNTP